MRRAPPENQAMMQDHLALRRRTRKALKLSTVMAAKPGPRYGRSSCVSSLHSEGGGVIKFSMRIWTPAYLIQFDPDAVRILVAVRGRLAVHPGQERIRRYAAELVALAPDCHPDGGHWKHGAAAGNSCCAGPRAPSLASELAPWERGLSE